MKKEYLKKHFTKFAFILTTFVGIIFILIGLGGGVTPDVSYEVFTLENQYIGDIAGCEDCLILVVEPIGLFYENESMYWDSVGEVKHLYFADENELLDIENGEIIYARWIYDEATGKRYISGVSTIDMLFVD